MDETDRADPQIDGIIDSSPAIGADGTIYLGSHDKKLYALMPDGKLKWSFLTGNTLISSPAIGDKGNIYFTSTDGNLYALKPDGAELWRSHAAGASPSSAVIDSPWPMFRANARHTGCVAPDSLKR